MSKLHFYYLDEAGCTGPVLSSDQQPVFVLGGVSVRDEGWNKTHEDYEKLLTEYFEGSLPEGFELHANNLLSPKGEGFFKNHERERRNQLAKDVLSLLVDRKHGVHLFAIDKQKLAQAKCEVPMNYDLKVPYLVAYDYLLTCINWFVNKKLGQSARGMLIIDIKKQYHRDIRAITYYRRFEDTQAHRIKWLVEFSYPVDSKRNSMIQISDLVVYCAKKFFEIEAGYKDDYNGDAKRFYAECYQIISDRQKGYPRALITRGGRNMKHLNDYLEKIQVKPSSSWKKKYRLSSTLPISK